MSKDKKQKIMMVGGITVGVMGVLWFVLISPLWTKLGDLRKQAENSRAQVEKGSRSASLVQQASNELAAASSQLTTRESLMAAGDLYAWMIQAMNRFKVSYAVDIPQISRETPCDVGMFPKFPYKAASFVVRGTGFYHDFGKFVADFENNFPYIRVQNLELSAQGGARNEDNEQLQFSIELVTLVKPVTP
jgi:Tfp pilus assembly protein PilO